MRENEVIYGLSKDFIFKEAVAFLESKKALPKEEYVKLEKEARAKAFTVSGYTSAEVLNEFLAELSTAVKEGKTKEAFREDMNHFLEQKGYEAVNPWKSDNIFRTNIQMAYNAGHYKSMTDVTVMKMRPYWQYYDAGDSKVRETHAAMNGRIYPADDPIWDVWFPPNGYKCRCGVRSLSKRQVAEKGLNVYDKPPFQVDYSTGEILPMFPDKGFSGNPAKDVWKPDTGKFSKEVKTAFTERQG